MPFVHEHSYQDQLTSKPWWHIAHGVFGRQFIHIHHFPIWAFLLDKGKGQKERRFLEYSSVSSLTITVLNIHSLQEERPRRCWSANIVLSYGKNNLASSAYTILLSSPSSRTWVKIRFKLGSFLLWKPDRKPKATSELAVEVWCFSRVECVVYYVLINYLTTHEAHCARQKQHRVAIFRVQSIQCPLRCACRQPWFCWFLRS